MKFRKWIWGAYWLFAMLYWETMAHGAMYEGFQKYFCFALGFGAALALVLAAAVTCLPAAAVFPVSLVLSLGVMLVYGSQMVYCFIFGTPYSVGQIGMGGDAVSQFWREMFSTMQDRIVWVLGLFVPIVILVILFRLAKPEKPGWAGKIVMVLLAAAVAGGVWVSIRSGGTGMYSNYYFFTSPKSTTTQTMDRFGVPMTYYLELTHTEEPEEAEEELFLAIPEIVEPQETEPEEMEKPPVYNVLDVDFDALNEATENKYLLALNDYCSRQTGTKQNEYTGMLKDYNLIMICAESFSPAAVDPVLTPTLYKLTHEGFLFRNFYTSFPNTTIDGEYSLVQGLYPDSIRGKYDSSMLSSSKHLLPFTLGNLFSQQRGIQCWGYHNNIGDFFSRNRSHPNLGYEMQFNHKGMEMSKGNPTSDLEMMEQSVDDYINQPQFHAYYMTFSGHYQYKPSVNSIAAKNYHLVEGLPGYGMEQKAYLACHIELDRAMEYLLTRLKQAGIDDKTAIVLAPDHVPYGLLKKQYFGMIDQPEDFFALYKSNLIFWVGGMEEPIEVNEYCSNVDVLPTILNLWGFDFDSRMLAGTDVFSDGTHAAVLIDRSFLTDKVWFNSNTGEVRVKADPSEIPEDYVENMNKYIASRFDFSTQALRQDYYRFVFGNKEEK